MTRFFLGTTHSFRKIIGLRGIRRYAVPGVLGIVLGLVAFLIVSACIPVGTSLLAQMRIQNAVNQLNQEGLTPQRHQAMWVLENSGERAVPALIVALHSNNPVLRHNAADILSYIVSPQVLETLQPGQ